MGGNVYIGQEASIFDLKLGKNKTEQNKTNQNRVAEVELEKEFKSL